MRKIVMSIITSRRQHIIFNVCNFVIHTHSKGIKYQKKYTNRRLQY